MPKNNSSKKNGRTKYNLSIEDFDKLHTSSKRRKRNNSNNEPDAEHSDSIFISNEKKIAMDHQNKHSTHKICGEAESYFKNNKNYETNHRKNKNKRDENNDNRPELPDKMDEKIENESNMISRSKKKKNKSSIRHHKDSLNCSNETENNNDTPNISSSTDKRSRSRHGHDRPHHKERSCSRSRNRDSSNNYCISNKTEKRNKSTNVSKNTYHGDSKFDANNESGSKHNYFNSDKKKTSLDQQKNKKRVEEMESNPSGTTQDIYGDVQKENNKKKKSKEEKNTISDHDSLNDDNKTKNDYKKPNSALPTTVKKSYGRDQTWSKNNVNEFSDKYCDKSKRDNKNTNSKLKYHQLNINDRDLKNNKYTGDAECTFNEIDEDLFNLPDEFSLAHCVAEDLKMGAGIAVEFKRIYGGVGKLFDQNLKVGDVGIINRHNRTVFYLITKKKSSGKPTMMSLRRALLTLLDKMKELNLTKLGIPQIGCGLDNLDWSNVSLLIKEIFSGSNIQITVCVPSSKIESKKSWPLKVYVTPINLWDMIAETVFIIFIDLGDIHQNNWTNNVVEEINKKYPFKENLLKDIKNRKLNPGNITEYHVNNEVIFCVFTNQNEYFTSIEEAFLKINNKKKLKYIYSAIQSGPMEDYVERIVLIYRSTVKNSELWLCGHPGQGNQLTYEKYCNGLHKLDITD
ncbi:Hypothetical protein CINCED_3A004486 [Cinara cedri]|uniref:Macro domain-containing protein n=1 Tax=Cinara cedri TaxID=506608 RepID=A0A5E4NK47_9HEMI|nr:Hypothetical protein CINCED_3A004486 [Cinara cedri]